MRACVGEGRVRYGGGDVGEGITYDTRRASDGAIPSTRNGQGEEREEERRKSASRSRVVDTSSAAEGGGGGDGS